MRKQTNIIQALRNGKETRLQQAKRLGIPEATLRRYEEQGFPKRPSAATRAHQRALGIAVA